MFNLNEVLDDYRFDECYSFNQKVFFHWIIERSTIYEKKTKGLPKPWTDDPIFQQYKFTNVEREHDTVSIWIKENWIDPYRDHPNLWFATAVS